MYTSPHPYFQTSLFPPTSVFPSQIIIKLLSLQLRKIPSNQKYRSSHWKLNNSLLDSPSILLYTKLFIKNLTYPINPIQHPLKWWDLFKTKIKYELILYSKIQQKKNSQIYNTLRNNLIKAKQHNQHDEISQLTLKLNQIYENKLNGAQIRSRLPPLSSIDDPSPLAPIIENLTQSKSLLPTDSNTPLLISLQKN